ncbi:baseplate wedge subunit and tail pin [Aeromonas phage AS-szw]|uniref:Baseplate wedge subunit and tail pin n=1 Tax=Aeromonas phage AS-szw TaxID=2026114 RepID=A0A291LDK3_9CAUD|nr:baseplate wedge subunit and tail pin [Aeromonas phage AS-szw]
MISIFQQPRSLTYYAGSSYQLSILASTNNVDAELRYSWESSVDSNTWTAVVDASAATDNLRVLPSNASYNHGYFRCRVKEVNSTSGAELSSLDSSVVTVTMFDGRTNTDMTRSRMASMIKSRKASDHEFNGDSTLETLSVVGGIGNLTIQDARSHNKFKTVENAISDAAYVGRLNKGSVIINIDNTDPSGKPQIDTLTFSGAISSPISGMPVVLDVFGTRIEVADGVSPTFVRDKVFDLLKQFEVDGLYVRDVTKLSSDSINFTYRDLRDHTPEPWSEYGMTVDWVVGSPASYGYGYWEMFFKEDKVAIDTTVTTLYYWKRIG